MTKKFLIAFSDQGIRKTRKNEFIVPNLDHLDNYFIGLESGKICQFGIVFYTGYDLDPNIIVQKLIKNKIVSQSSALIEKTLEEYLTFIKSCKISDVIGINIESDQYKYFVTGFKSKREISNIP
jgi:hypothetical protein